MSTSQMAIGQNSQGVVHSWQVNTKQGGILVHDILINENSVANFIK